MSRPRVTDAVNKDAEIESDETLSVSIDDDRKVSLRYVITRALLQRRQQGEAVPVQPQATIETGPPAELHRHARQRRRRRAAREGSGDGRRSMRRTASRAIAPDRIVAAKLQGTQLVLYRTDGNAYPETIELAKQ